MPDVPTEPLEHLRAICLELPEVAEEEAWTGVRWVVRRKNFAHLVAVDHGWPPAYARAAGSDGPLVVVTFRVPEPEFFVDGRARAPFFYPGWFVDLVGLVIDEGTDWDEVRELVTESYCVLAPKKLVAELPDPRPNPAPGHAPADRRPRR